MSSAPASIGGIYFVAPFPAGWEVCAYRFDRYPDIGHALTWELAVAPQLALRWGPHLYSTAALERTPELVIRLQASLAPLYDAVPRGRVVPLSTRGAKHRIYHGDDLSPGMKIKSRAVEQALGLSGNPVWQEDEHETRNADSVEQLACLLPITSKCGPKGWDRVKMGFPPGNLR